MKYIINDEKYHFKSAFDTETGAYIRTGILDENGRDTGVDHNNFDQGDLDALQDYLNR